MMVSGLAAMPVSTTEVTRRNVISPCSSTSASTTVAMKLANDGCRHTPRPTRGGSGWPQPAFSAAKFHRVLARLARQFVHEAFDGKHVVVGADPAPESGRYRRRLGPHIFDMD